MPAKKKGASQQKRGQKEKRAGVVGLSNQPLLFPDRFHGKMTYDTFIQVTPAAGAAIAHVWRANSVYDPDYTGVGSTVMGYTQAAQLYNRYRVVSVTAHVSFVNTNTTPCTIFCVSNISATVGTNITSILGQRHVWFSGLDGIGGMSNKSHKFSVTTAKIFGVPKQQVLAEDDFAGIVGGVPNNVVYLHLGAHSNSGSAGAVNVHLRLVYDVIWSMPLTLAP